MRHYVIAIALLASGCMTRVNNRTGGDAQAPQTIQTPPVTTPTDEPVGKPQPPDVVRINGDHLEIFEQVMQVNGGFNEFKVTDTAGVKKFVATWSYVSQVDSNLVFKGYSAGATQGKTLCKMPLAIKWEGRNGASEIVSSIDLKPSTSMPVVAYTAYTLALSGEIQGECRQFNAKLIVAPK